MSTHYYDWIKFKTKRKESSKFFSSSSSIFRRLSNGVASRQSSITIMLKSSYKYIHHSPCCDHLFIHINSRHSSSLSVCAFLCSYFRFLLPVFFFLVFLTHFAWLNDGTTQRFISIHVQIRILIVVVFFFLLHFVKHHC